MRTEPDTVAELREANQLLRAEQWAQALQIYLALAEKQPRLAPILRANIEIARLHAQEPAAPVQAAAPVVAIAQPREAPAPATATRPQAPAVVEARQPEPPASPRVPAAAAPTTDRRLLLADLYDQVARTPDAAHALQFKKGECPLVSVVVTAHNTQDYVEECLESLLSQSYPNLEIIVVDDASSDLTPAVVRRVGRSNAGIRLFQLNANLGTYFAKNLGLQHARGEVMFFQDSDDICHPWRIALQMHKLLSVEQAQVVRGAYARVDPETQRVILVNGLASKLGLITLGVRRKVFEQIGFFNCTTKASDDEFYNRVLRYLGKPATVDLPLPLYYNTMREGSLFADMVHWGADGNIEQKPSASRAAYVDTFKAAHTAQEAAAIRKTFAFPRVRDPLPVAPEMSKLANPDVPVVVNLCSIPERERTLERTLRSIGRQCDRIHLYLDRYEREPAFLRQLPVPVRVLRSQEIPGLRDNGKFYALDEMSRAGDDAYYFTLDDDIEYPADYVNAMVKTLQAHGDDVVVGVHGVTLRDQPRGYFSDRRMVHSFTKALERSRLVNVLGTGTTAFRASRFAGFDLGSFTRAGMADIFFALECKRRGLPQLCVARFENWLRELADPNANSLFTEFKGDDTPQTELLLSGGPWGFAGIAGTVDALRARNPAAAEELHSALPLLRGVTRSPQQP